MSKDSKENKSPLEFSSSEASSSESDSSCDGEDKDICLLKHTPSERSVRYEDARFLAETCIEIDFKKDFTEELESLYPLQTVEIKESRHNAKEFSDLDKNYPYDPIPGHVLRFSVYAPKEHLIFKASNKLLKGCDSVWTDYLFDNLFLLPQGQFLFRVHRRTTFASHMFRSNYFGNSAVVTSGDFGNKYLGRIDQIFSFGKTRRFRFQDRNAQICLNVEAPSSAWVKKLDSDKELKTKLEYKFPNGKLYAKLEFSGSYANPPISKKCSLKLPSLVCDESTTTITFENLDYRTPVELRAFVFASYFLFYHQYWEYKRCCFFPWVLFYIILVVLIVVLHLYNTM